VLPGYHTTRREICKDIVHTPLKANTYLKEEKQSRKKDVLEKTIDRSNINCCLTSSLHSFMKNMRTMDQSNEPTALSSSHMGLCVCSSLLARQVEAPSRRPAPERLHDACPILASVHGARDHPEPFETPTCDCRQSASERLFLGTTPECLQQHTPSRS
jgi:hypothetical protein